MNYDEELKIVESTKAAAIDMVEEVKAHALLNHVSNEQEEALVNAMAESIAESIKSIRPYVSKDSSWSNE